MNYTPSPLNCERIEKGCAGPGRKDRRRLALLMALALLIVFGASTSDATQFGKSHHNSPAQTLPACGRGYEKSGALCYPECKAGYNGVGPVCWEICPEGFTNDGATCRKNAHIISRDSYGRGAGSVLGCASNEEKDGALCYPECKAGYNGQGPVCWQKCPEGYTNDGATCRRNAKIISVGQQRLPWVRLVLPLEKESQQIQMPSGSRL